VIHPRSVAAGLLVIAFALSAAACGGVKNPEGWASPVDQDSTLFYFPEKDRVAAVRLEDGFARQAWTFPADNREDHEDLKFKAVYDAAIADGILYFGAWDGPVLALHTENGEVAWAFDRVQGGIVGGPVVQDGIVAFGTTEGRIYVRDARTGEPAPGWPENGLDLSDGIWAPPVIEEGRLFIATMGGDLLAFDLASGREAWDAPFEASGAIADLALVAPGRLFVPSLDKRVRLVDTATGRPIGPAFVARDWIWTRPAVADGYMYFGDFSGNVYALSIENLSERWIPYDAGKRIKAAPVVIGDTLVVATRDPEVHFIDIRNGQRLNTVPIPDAGTVRAGLIEHDGMAIVATTRGRLFVADPESWRVVGLDVAGAQ